MMLGLKKGIFSIVLGVLDKTESEGGVVELENVCKVVLRNDLDEILRRKE